MNTQKTVASQTAVHDESILVVKRDTLFKDIPAWHGIHQVDFAHYLTIINQYQEFQPRSLMEVDPTFKQIIPYLIFTHDNKYFLMQRTAHATEQRLQSKFSLGIGGHIRQEDMTENSLFAWATREFHEEVSYAGNVRIEPLGILNDDSNEVGKVHIGFVFLLHGDCPDIRVNSELKSGELMTLQEIEPLYQRLESWSQMVFDQLKK